MSVLVMKLFTAPWCGPCKAMKPLYEEFSEEHGIKLQRLDISASPDIVNQYSVRSVPTMIYYEDGVEKARVVGSITKVALKEKLGY